MSPTIADLSSDLTEEENISLSFSAPNLHRVIHREPRYAENNGPETRQLARQELAWILRELNRLRRPA